MKRKILIADDAKKTTEDLAEVLRADARFEVDVIHDGESALERVRGHDYNFLITDLKMPGLDGMELVRRLRDDQNPLTVIVMTGYGTVDEAVEAIKLGAYDFLTKPVDPDRLTVVMERALREHGLRDEVIQLRQQLEEKYTFQNVISKSPRMHVIFELIKNVADTDATVLIEGETGTGKEQIARAVHAASHGRRKGELVAVNCAALPETLLESELFGHEKGAFTGAAGQRRGRFEAADGGTIFLDEAGDIPLPMQAKLLRVLQERTIERIGGATPVPVDVRVIAATNRNLKRLVRQGKFREDLYYRLNVVKIDLPPLRDRAEDIPLLAAHFAQKHGRPGATPPTFIAEAMEKLMAHHWPGNIRELENAVERACVTARDGEVRAADLPPELSQPQPVPLPTKIDLKVPLPTLLSRATVELEKQYLKRALKKTRGNVGKCAEICGLSRRSISAKLAEYDINKEDYKKRAE